MSETKTICIVGAGHSGSTLLDLLLGSNSNICSIGEIGNWDHYIEEDKVCSCGEPTSQCEFWADIHEKWQKYKTEKSDTGSVTDTRGGSINGFLSRQFYRFSFVASIALSKFITTKNLAILFPNVFERIQNNFKLFDYVREASKRPVICDSTKSINRFRLFHLSQPKSTKAIFLSRDGRAVVASHVERRSADPAKVAKNWQFVNFYTRIMLRNLPTESHMHIRYEELCREPEKTLRKICSFIDCPFDSKMLMFSGASQHNIGGNRMRMNGVSEIQEDLKWRSILSAEQLQEFDKIAGDTNSKLLGQYLTQ